MIDVMLCSKHLRLSIASRLDIIVKYLYALNYLGKLPNFASLDTNELYHKHIHIRTGSKEPGDESRKSDINDFCELYEELIESLKQGYNAQFPIPISSKNQLPLNGAHRIAASLALGVTPEIIFSDENIGGSWDSNWFKNAGFSRNELNIIIKAFTYSQKYQDMYFFILWQPSSELWGSIEKDLSEYFNKVYEDEECLSQDSFNEFVRDVYSYDCGPKTAPNIERKLAYLNESEGRFKYLIMESKAPLTPKDLKAIKQKIRKKYQDVCPLDKFITLHFSESKGEFKHLEDILLNEENMKVLKTRSQLSEDFIDKLYCYQQKLEELNITKSKCCVVGSSILNGLNLRKADDIDFTLLKNERDEKFDNGVTKMGEIDVVAYNYARTFSFNEMKVTDTQLIQNPKYHIFLRGLKFAHPKIVLQRKQHQRRKKDIDDIKLLGQYLRANACF
ncbi:hypothetical protein [Paraglaciecola aestuariivivens]